MNYIFFLFAWSSLFCPFEEGTKFKWFLQAKFAVKGRIVFDAYNLFQVKSRHFVPPGFVKVA
ncbi:MAG: hypothetical protein CL402_06885 [Acidiferrobacteraceae bacterium]|nr:hypothetical protein [Acidiferrobacteraceae bacterium]